MSSIRELFNKEALVDRAKGAALGMAAGFALSPLNPVAMAIGGFTGFIVGADGLKEVFNAAVAGREMVPALATVAARKPTSYKP